MKRVVLTGATGFVGQVMLDRLYRTPEVTTVWVKRGPYCAREDRRGTLVQIPDIGPDADWLSTVKGAQIVIHAAGRAHLMRGTPGSTSIAEFRRVNVAGSANLARQAAASGVRRFIFISSIKVNGDTTTGRTPFTESDVPAPPDPYGTSKWEAEQELRNIAAETGMEVVIIRPPLVYGPGVKANFLALMRCVYRGIPLPLASIQNRRSLVALDNLVDLIAKCMDHPAAAHQTFLVSDGHDLSTTQLLNAMGVALGRRARLFRMPSSWLAAGARLSGRTDLILRLCGSLEIDMSRTRSLLDWTPPVLPQDALERTAHHFLSHARD